MTLPPKASKKKLIGSFDDAKALAKDPFTFLIGKGAEVAIDHILFDKARREEAAWEKSQADPNRKWQRDVGGYGEYGPTTEIAGKAVQPRLPIQGTMRGLATFTQQLGKSLTGNAPIDNRLRTIVADTSVDANKRSNPSVDAERNDDPISAFFVWLGRLFEGK